MADRSPQGPLKEFSGKVVAVVPCKADPTHKPIEVKVNSSGWPYYICPLCIQEKAQSLAAAKSILSLHGIRWVKGRKAPVLAALETPRELVTEVADTDGYELEELPPEPVKKRGIRTYFDD